MKRNSTYLALKSFEDQKSQEIIESVKKVRDEEKVKIENEMKLKIEEIKTLFEQRVVELQKKCQRKRDRKKQLLERIKAVESGQLNDTNSMQNEIAKIFAEK